MQAQEIPLEQDDIFPDMASAKFAIQRHAVSRGESFVVAEAKKRYYLLKCREETCTFKIRATLLERDEQVHITIYRPHICSPITHTHSRVVATSKRIGQEALASVNLNPKIPPRQIRENEQVYLGTQLTYKQAWRGKERALRVLGRDEDATYGRFPSLVSLIRNLDATPTHSNYAALRDKDGVFDCFFVAPAATRSAFPTYRPYTALDGTHTKSRHQMTMLIAVGMDADGRIVPLAWSLTTGENAETWSFFLQHFRLAFPTAASPDHVFISDRQKGLLNGLNLHFPMALPLHCCQHLAENVQLHHGVAAKKLFWSCAYASSQDQFTAALAKLRQAKPAAADYVAAINPEQWATYAVRLPRYGKLTSNIVESQNWVWLSGGQRYLEPLDAMISCYLGTMELFYTRRLLIQSASVTKHAVEWIRSRGLNARRLKCQSSDEGTGSVSHSNGRSHLVDLPARRCSCGEYQEMGLPCEHALALCFHQSLDPYLFVDPAYSSDVYRTQYSYVLPLIRVEDTSMPTENPLQAPLGRALVGRPKEKRIRREDRVKQRHSHKKVYTCTQCKAAGHTRRSCRSAM